MDVKVREAGEGPVPHALVFDVRANPVAQNGTSVEFEEPQGDYVDDTTVTLRVSGELVPGESYRFYIRARNTYGSSEFVNSSIITVQGKYVHQ